MSQIIALQVAADLVSQIRNVEEEPYTDIPPPRWPLLIKKDGSATYFPPITAEIEQELIELETDPATRYNRPVITAASQRLTRGQVGYLEENSADNILTLSWPYHKNKKRIGDFTQIFADMESRVTDLPTTAIDAPESPSAGGAGGVYSQNPHTDTIFDGLADDAKRDMAAAVAFGTIPADANLVNERRWIVDTGASQHMVSIKQVDKSQLITASKPYKLYTANGKVESWNRYRAYIPMLDDYVEAVVLESTPAALSVGLLTEVGYSFHWDARGHPHLLRPNGTDIHMFLEHHVPYLSNFTDMQVAAMAPAHDISGECAPTSVTLDKSPAASAADCYENFQERLAELDYFSTAAPVGPAQDVTPVGGDTLCVASGGDVDSEENPTRLA